jgi:hypothetical protein
MKISKTLMILFTFLIVSCKKDKIFEPSTILAKATVDTSILTQLNKNEAFRFEGQSVGVLIENWTIDVSVGDRISWEVEAINSSSDFVGIFDIGIFDTSGIDVTDDYLLCKFVSVGTCEDTIPDVGVSKIEVELISGAAGQILKYEIIFAVTRSAVTELYIIDPKIRING